MMRDVRDDPPADDAWLSTGEIARLLDAPLRTVQNSFTNETLRAQWWEPGGVRAWRTKPLTRRTEYQARRWAVMRLVDQDEPES